MATLKLTVIRGDTRQIDITVKDEQGNPVDLTGAKVWFTVKKNLNDTDDDAVIQKSTTTHTNPTGGQTSITLTSTDTDINPGSYYFDIQIKFNDGTINSISYGIFEVLADITRTTV